MHISNKIAFCILAFAAANAKAQESGEIDATGNGSDVAIDAYNHEQSTAATETGLDSIAVTPAGTTSEATETRSSSGNRFIEEVVVTAQKREEKLQDVPISVTAFSGDQLDALGVSDPKDLALVTPGLTYSSLVGYSIIYIRGVGTDVFIPSADTSVATYIDGVYFPFAQNLATSFTKLERIEVLKGPQGTLFGRNSTGGAINVISKKPSNVFSASADVTISNFDGRNVKAFVTGPLIGDTVSGSLSLLYDQAGQYHTFASDSPIQSLQNDKTKGVNARLRWDPTDDVSALISTYLTRFRGVSSVISANTNTTPLGTAAGAGSDGTPYEVSLSSPIFLNANNDVIYGSLEYRNDPFDSKLLLSHERVITDTLFDYDAGPGNVADFDVPDQYFRVTTGELQFVSKPGGWLSDENIEWTAGYYYFHSQGGYDPADFRVLNPDSPTLAGGLAGILGGALDKLNELGLPTLPNMVKLELHGVIKTTAHAGYMQGTWRPEKWFGLTLGGRYQSEDRGLVKSNSGIARDGADAIPLFSFALPSTTTNSFSPKVTIETKPFEDNTMFYASWQKGYKSGTYNIVSIYSPPNYVKPEEVNAYEVGVKGDFLDSTLRYNAAVFQNNIKNLQTLVVSLASGGTVQLANAAQATIRGVDFDLTWQALPELAPGFVITADGSYLRGKYDDFPNAPGFDPVTGLYFGPGALVPSAPQNFAGNKTVRTPKYSAALGLGYSFSMGAGTLELGANGSYNSGYFYDTQNTATQPEFYTINSRASYLYDPWGVRVTAFVKNLSNQVYFLNKFTNDFGTNTTWAAPRQYGVTVGWEF